MLLYDPVATARGSVTLRAKRDKPLQSAGAFPQILPRYQSGNQHGASSLPEAFASRSAARLLRAKAHFAASSAATELPAGNGPLSIYQSDGIHLIRSLTPRQRPQCRMDPAAPIRAFAGPARR